MTKTEARVKKQRGVDKNTIIFPAEYYPRGPEVNAIIKRLLLVVLFIYFSLALQI